MDFIKNFFKKYASLIVPVVVTVIAIVLFVPSVMISGSVKENLKSSASNGDNVRSSIRKAVSVNQWALEAKYQDAFEADANSIEALARQTSMRDILRYGIFPEPKVTSTQLYYEFGEKYIKAIEGLSRVMNAGDAPSEQALSSLSGSSGGGGSRGRNLRGGSSSSDAKDVVRDTACKEKAARISVYANPETSFVGFGMWDEYEFVNQDTAVSDCWYSQIAYWIQEDIAKTIAKMNSGSSSVLSSKVKRLLGVSFDSSEVSTSSNKVEAGMPSYIGEEDKVGLAPVWTGRTSSGEIDVVHFSIAVIIDVKAEPEFYSELCGLKKHSFKGWEGELEDSVEYVHNQITVLEHSMEPIDIKDAEHERYRYGDGTAVKLNLVCEYVFNRSYDKVKPAEIKESLGQEEEGAVKEDENKSKKRGRRSSRSKRSSKK